MRRDDQSTASGTMQCSTISMQTRYLVTLRAGFVVLLLDCYDSCCLISWSVRILVQQLDESLNEQWHLKIQDTAPTNFLNVWKMARKLRLRCIFLIVNFTHTRFLCWTHRSMILETGDNEGFTLKSFIQKWSSVSWKRWNMKERSRVIMKGREALIWFL